MNIPISTRLNIKTAATIIRYYSERRPWITKSEAIRMAMDDYAMVLIASGRTEEISSVDEATRFLELRSIPRSVAQATADENSHVTSQTETRRIEKAFKEARKYISREQK